MLWQLKQDICEFGRRLWQLGFVAANDGNISARCDEDRVLATPTGVSKGFMEPGMLIVCDMQGELLAGDRAPSSELAMHLEIYRLRPDVRAVVHAHPPVATAFAAAGVALDKCALPESVLSLGAIPVAPYGTPSTEEIPASIRPFVPRCDAVLLANHGAVCWADSLEGAYFRMETLEHTARITMHALQLGGVQPLSAADVEKLQAVRAKMGLRGRVLPCEVAGTCPVLSAEAEASARRPQAEPELVALVERVARDVLARLKE
ncbi:MAG: class II aldolase/adducin family protein [Deltaproteobacteria bacterium]|nr:class II aldolase/adducin family protein [Deltaproteobacteria bacterium]